MTYTAFCKFYGLAQTTETFEDWLFAEWTHGRAYRENNSFYSTMTGTFIGSCRQ